MYILISIVHTYIKFCSTIQNNLVKIFIHTFEGYALVCTQTEMWSLVNGLLYLRVWFPNWNRVWMIWNQGSEILKVDQNMILGPHAKRKRDGSDDSAMTID